MQSGSVFLLAPCFCLGARARRAALGNGALSARASPVLGLEVLSLGGSGLDGARGFEPGRLRIGVGFEVLRLRVSELD